MAAGCTGRCGTCGAAGPAGGVCSRGTTDLPAEAAPLACATGTPGGVGDPTTGRGGAGWAACCDGLGTAPCGVLRATRASRLCSGALATCCVNDGSRSCVCRARRSTAVLIRLAWSRDVAAPAMRRSPVFHAPLAVEAVLASAASREATNLARSASLAAAPCSLRRAATCASCAVGALDIAAPPDCTGPVALDVRPLASMRSIDAF